MQFEQRTLSNGIRVVHSFNSSSKAAHCGFVINAGSRDELLHEHGLAHFIEHSLFKGTKKRKAFHILSRMEIVGGELNAYTTKEDTCIYASFSNEYYARSIEILSDILFNSVFPTKEINKEKEVICDEINYYEDTPSELIFEDFDENFLGSNSFGRSILGTPETLATFTADSIHDFMNRNYFIAEQIVFSSVGNISIDKLVPILEKALKDVKLRTGNLPKRLLEKRNPFFSEVSSKPISQSHYIIGVETHSAKSEKARQLALLTNYLGGSALNSRLNLLLREKMGITYGVEASYTSYTDVGMFNVYISLDKKNLNRAIRTIKKEFARIQANGLTPHVFAQVKKQFIGQFLLAQESKSNTMLTAGKSVLLFNKVDEDEEVVRKINNIKLSDFNETAYELLDYDKYSSLFYEQEK